MEKYFINNEEVTEEEFNSRLEEEVSNEVTDGFDDFLDEIYPEYEMGSLTVSASAIAHIDEGWYNEALNEQIDFELSEKKYELENRDEVSVNGFEFRIEHEVEE